MTVMLLAAITLLVATIPTLLGLLCSYLIIWRGRRGDTRSLNGRMPLILGNLVVVAASTTSAYILFSDRFTPTPPAMTVLIAQLLLILVGGDICFYWTHRLLHSNRYLYSRIHHIHHRANAPLPIEYMYVHPLEWMIGSIGPYFVLLGILLTTGQLSIWTLWSYVIFRQFHELDLHSGIPAIIAARIPCLGTADHHDLHHARPALGNFGSIFTIWDKMFGTEARPISSAMR